MLENITIGQYYPGDSVVHRLDPRTKLIITLFYIVVLFISKNIVSILIGVSFGLVVYLISGITLKFAWRSIKSILPVVAFTAVLNMFFVSGTVLFKFYFIEITDAGLNSAVIMTIRIIALIAGTSLLTYTTSPIALTDGIEKLFGPLKRFRFPVHEIAMMMTIALRFIPTLIEETQKIMSAQKARGADMESGGIVQRMKAMVPILIPLFISAFRRADELALAMESRAYRGGEGRTKMRQFHYGRVDLFAVVTVLAFLALVLFTNQYFAFLVF